MAVVHVCLMLALAGVGATRAEDITFHCKSHEPQYISDDQLQSYCGTFNRPYKIQTDHSMMDLVHSVRDSVAVLYSRVDRIYRQNVTWDSGGCSMTSTQYFLELENFCIFKEHQQVVTEINPEYRQLSGITRVYTKCPFDGLDVGQNLIISSNGLSIDNVHDDSADIIGEQKISLDDLFEATDEAVEQTARVCGMEKARVPDRKKGSVPVNDLKYSCPTVVRDEGFKCDNTASTGSSIRTHSTVIIMTLGLLILTISYCSLLT